MRRIKTVLAIFNAENDVLRQNCNGICRYANKVRWHVEMLLVGDVVGHLSEILDFWQPIGVLIDATRDPALVREISLRVPTVSLDDFAAESRPGIPTIGIDNAACARLAFDELRRCGFSSFAFLHYAHPAPLWSRQRAEAFVRLVRDAGGECLVHSPPASHPDRIGYLQDITEWLAGLPKPIGLFAANDIVAADALIAANRAAISVPSELSVIGVDDNVEICSKSSPPLTSVRPDPEERGFLAAKMLAQAIRRKSVKSKVVYPPSGVTRRNSTRIVTRKDSTVDAACKLIAAKACGGLTAREVLALFPCSRTLAQRRFREVTGRSILSAIQDRRLERACELLSHREQDLGAIANMCGYATPNALRKVFTKKTGLPPRAWQKRH